MTPEELEEQNLISVFDLEIQRSLSYHAGAREALWQILDELEQDLSPRAREHIEDLAQGHGYYEANPKDLAFGLREQLLHAE